MATEQEMRERLNGLNNALKVFGDEKEELEQKLGIKRTRDVSGDHKQEDESASLFDRMSSAELMELYRTDRAKWQEIMDGVCSCSSATDCIRLLPK